MSLGFDAGSNLSAAVAAAGASAGSGATLNPNVEDQYIYSIDHECDHNAFLTVTWEGSSSFQEATTATLNTWFRVPVEWHTKFCTNVKFMELARQYEFWRGVSCEVEIRNIVQHGQQADLTFMGATQNAKFLYYIDHNNLYSPTLGYGNKNTDTQAWLNFFKSAKGVPAPINGGCTPTGGLSSLEPLTIPSPDTEWNTTHIHQRDPRVHQIACNTRDRAVYHWEAEDNHFRSTRELLAVNPNTAQQSKGTQQFRFDNFMCRYVAPYMTHYTGIPFSAKQAADKELPPWVNAMSLVQKDDRSRMKIDTVTVNYDTANQWQQDLYETAMYTTPIILDNPMPGFFVKGGVQFGQDQNVIKQAFFFDLRYKYTFEFKNRIFMEGMQFYGRSSSDAMPIDFVDTIQIRKPVAIPFYPFQEVLPSTNPKTYQTVTSDIMADNVMMSYTA